MMLWEIFSAARVHGEYYVGDVRRWDLGWPTPNSGGCFLVCALPFLWLCRPLRWGGASGRVLPGVFRAQPLILAVEAPLFFTLCRTYSRGSLVALVGAAVAFLATVSILGPEARRRIQRRTLQILFGERLAILAACLLLTGFDHRIGLAAAGGDPSVNHRMAFWEASPEMIVSAPWRGWGGGASGRAYMNWFQRTEATEGFLTPVNSYLHIAIEYGLPALATILLVVQWPALVLGMGAGKRVFGDEAVIFAIAGCIAVVVAYLLCNLFATLWTSLPLLALPAAALAFIYRSAASSPAKDWMLAGGMAAALLGTGLGAILTAGAIRRHQHKVRIAAEIDGSVDLIRGPLPGVGGRRAAAWLDPLVLGAAPGKELRNWLLANPDVSEVRVIPESSGASRPFAGADLVLLVGRYGPQISGLAVGQAAILINPSGQPPDIPAAMAAHVRLVLPEVDETGDGYRWEQWAARLGARIVIAVGCGRDVRLCWPAIATLDRD